MYKRQELKQQLDKESGEVVIILDENAVPSVDTRVIINISTSKHNACKALLDQTSAHVGARCTKLASYDNTDVLLIRNEPQSAEDHIEVRVAILGNVDAGKSTLLGLSLIHISEPTRLMCLSRMPSSA